MPEEFETSLSLVDEEIVMFVTSGAVMEEDTGVFPERKLKGIILETEENKKPLIPCFGACKRDFFCF